MIGKKDIRDYEISVWTLQDSFITVLKLSSNSEKRGDIEDPQMVLKDDGENTLSFKIPMYLHSSNNTFIENPIWYNTINGNIISSLRKIKVIFNKNTKEEGIYEFIITNVEESHEGYEKYCNVSCEGLAFHELGKQGYKIVLEGVDEISLAQKEWFEGSQQTPIPQGNITYWADKIFKNTNWRYSVQMDWSSYDGILNDTYGGLHGVDYASFTAEEKDRFNSGRENAGLRRRDTIYEDEYVSNWTEINNQLIATSKENFTEKYRMVEASESNRYNLSQTVAEMFQVFCKYKYYYDENYHIIDREVIFYNNFLKESEGIIDLTYNYDTQQLTRNMDGTDTITKMFVRSLDDEDMPSGQITISDTTANKSLEDYILNFDYLYNIGAISKEQYNEVEIYQAKMHKINTSIVPLQEKIIELENDRIKLEAKVQTAKDSVQMATENLDNINLVNNSITGGDGVVSITNLNPQSLVLVKENSGNNYYVKLKINGIKRETIRLYKTYNSSTNTLSNLISQFNVETDETGNINKITNIKVSLENTTTIWATFDYSLKDYYEKVSQYYAKKMQQEKNVAEVTQEKLDNVNSQLEQKKNELDALVTQKENVIKNFECFMGPALREGNWQPEDEYSGYGTVYNETLQVNVNSIYDNNKIVSFGWDKELFDEEQDLFYYFGVQGDKHYYPCIELTAKILNKFNTYDDFSKLSFVYTLNGTSNQGDKEYLTLGSKMISCFINNNNNIVPVLLLIGADNISDVQLNAMKNNGHLSIININNSGSYEENLIESTSGLNWIISPKDISKNFSYKMVYPRILINSNYVKSPQTQLYLKRENELLENYKDFSILNRDSKLYVALKPEVFFRTPKNINITYSINFVVSTSALAIYLDALQVLKENAYPKVSYEIDLMGLNTKLIHDDYQRLGQIAHINDAEFKFQNTLGYISEVDLDLDHPWQDKIVIKNYKTKFEDLFSTIVAETEEMKKNSGLFNSLASILNPYGMLNDNLINDIANKLPVELERVISPAEAYAEYEPFVRQELKKSWEEAGKILVAATSSVKDVNEVILEGADILAGFKENVKENLTPTTFSQYPRESENFKIGDVWRFTLNNIQYEYLATENSSQVNYNGETLPREKSLRGWSLAKDGSLAQIKGAALNIDAENGKIDLEAETSINLRSGKDINIQANDHLLVQANNVVDITGSQINIGSLSSDPDKGVKIVSSTASNAANATSYVDIKPSGISMATANGITFKSGGGLNFSTSDGANTSAISIDKDKGIYLGSNAPLIFYSGNITESTVNNRKTFTGSGAAAKFTKDRILFGVSGGNSGTAVDMTKEYILLGSAKIDTNTGEPSEEDVENTGTKGGAAGVKITKDYIRMATGAANTSERNYFSMDKSGIRLANTTEEANGALVSISQKGVIIGVAGNKATFTTPITAGQAFSGDYSGARFQVYAPNFVVDADGHLYAYGADIAGEIRAITGQIGGWTIGSNYLGNASTRAASTIGISIPSDSSSDNFDVFWAGGTPGHEIFVVTKAGKLTATGADITGDIKATSGAFGNGSNKINIGTNGTNSAIYNGKTTKNSTSSGFYIGTDGISFGAYASGHSPFEVGTDGKLYATGATISGALTATTLSTGGRTSASATNGFYIDSNGAIYGGQNKFKVTSDGKLTTTSGSIGGWNVDDNSIYSGTKGNSTANGDMTLSTVNFTRAINGTDRSGLRLAIGKNFGVHNNGTLYAHNVDISGKIHATSLDINGEDFQKFIGGDAYVTKTSLYVDSTKGIIKGSALKQTIDGKTVISGTTMELDSDGNLKFESISGINNVATLSMSNGWITLSTKSGTSTFSNSSAVKIGPSKIDISSSGTFTLDSTNLKVNTDGNGTVEVVGKITSTSGSIGGWAIDSNSIYSGTKGNSNSNGDVTLSTTNFTRTINNTSRTGLRFGIGKNFGVKNDGTLYAAEAVISGAITATSFNLGSGVEIPSNKITGFSDLQTQVNNIDNDLATANAKATSASKKATALAGLVGRTFVNDGLSSDETYAVKLTSTGRLLIGANSGIDIWNTNSENSGGAAISFDKNAIALHGAAINITTASATGTNVIALNTSGITLASSTKMTLNGSAIELNASGSNVVKINTSGITLGSTGKMTLNGSAIELKASSSSDSSIVEINTDGITLGSTGKLVCQMPNFSLDAEGNLLIGKTCMSAFILGAWSFQGGMALVGQSMARFTGTEFDTYKIGTDKGAWRTIDVNALRYTYGYNSEEDITREAYNPFLQRARIVLNTNDVGWDNTTKEYNKLGGKNYAIWIGADGATTAPFSVRRDGVVTVSDIIFQQYYVSNDYHYNHPNETISTLTRARFDSSEKAKVRYSLAFLINQLIHDPSSLSHIWLSENGDKPTDEEKLNT